MTKVGKKGLFIFAFGLIYVNAFDHNRKIRSLNNNNHNYDYNDLRLISKYYHEKPYYDERQQVANNQQIDSNGEELEFLPSLQASGQLETIGHGYQHLNNRYSNDYNDYANNLEQEPIHSAFRERERSSSRKRGTMIRHPSYNEEALTNYYLNELKRQTLENDERQRIVDELYDRYKNQLYRNNDGGQTMQRRNVNARYPYFNHDYNNVMSKRFPVSKRSPKAIKKQLNDPKVIHDLDGLFGTQSQNSTNNLQNNNQHKHNMKKATSEKKDKSLKKENSAGQKEEPIKISKRFDWSANFGIDRRKKKSAYSGKPGNEEQDEKYLLQRYFQIMSNNLKSNDNENEEIINPKPKFTKDIMIDDSSSSDVDDNDKDQEIKNELMTRYANAYTFEKLQKAINQLRNNALAELESRRNRVEQNNSTDYDKRNVKRFNDNSEKSGMLEYGNVCPEIDVIDKHCRRLINSFTENLVIDLNQILVQPCVTYYFCNACNQREEYDQGCLDTYALDTDKVCRNQEEFNSNMEKSCLQISSLLPLYRSPISISKLCYSERSEPCLEEFDNRYRQQFSRSNVKEGRYY